jgi:hypothetical protein
MPNLLKAKRSRLLLMALLIIVQFAVFFFIKQLVDTPQAILYQAF